MNKYNDMFNERFSDDDFNGDPMKKEQARIVFNKVMDSLSRVTDNIKLSDDMFRNLLNLFGGDNELDNSIMFPISTEDESERLIKEFDINLESLKVKRGNSFNIVSESWTNSESGHTIKKKYILNKSVFITKNKEIQLEIVNALIDSNLDYSEYIELLPKPTRVKLYKDILDNLVSEERYEEAAYYRDKIIELSI